ncbi:hypothetical protein GGR53DRAFT_364402 [Hypoxylon sp. FL1150]|nr:hypothetical protein GGR53DRAFT_364402 [Hypoxylon sp. FL1150]
MLYCAYCGKSFTRKEHLERHLPTHTNVKPHRCGSCQLSFARRDLLNRHYATYHEARDPSEPQPGSVPTVAGRTPIACLNCAQAKTGCDKRVPCTRCTDKHLECQARFARRSSKAAMRAAQISQNQVNVNRVSPHMPSPAQATHTSPISPTTINPASIGIHHSAPQNETPGLSAASLPPGDSPNMLSIDPRIRQQQQQQLQQPHQQLQQLHQHNSPTNGKGKSPAISLVSGPEFTASGDTMDDFFMAGNSFMPDMALPIPDFQDTNPFLLSEYPVDFDIFGTSLPLHQGHMPTMPAFPELTDISSASEHMGSSESVRTRSTSVMSPGEFDSTAKPIDMAPSIPPSTRTEPLAHCTPPPVCPGLYYIDSDGLVWSLPRDRSQKD